MLSDSDVNEWRDYAFDERGRPLKYRYTTTQTVNHKTGEITRSVAETTIDKALYSSTEGDESAVREVRVRVADLPFFPPRKLDVIRIGSRDYQIEDWTGSQTSYVTDIKLMEA